MFGYSLVVRIFLIEQYICQRSVSRSFFYSLRFYSACRLKCFYFLLQQKVAFKIIKINGPVFPSRCCAYYAASAAMISCDNSARHKNTRVWKSQHVCLEVKLCLKKDWENRTMHFSPIRFYTTSFQGKCPA